MGYVKKKSMPSLVAGTIVLFNSMHVLRVEISSRCMTMLKRRWSTVSNGACDGDDRHGCQQFCIAPWLLERRTCSQFNNI